MLRKLLMAALAAGCFACNDGIEVTTDITVPETKIAVSLNELAGYYTDTLPCASCEGILTGLSILTDSTFFLTEQYLTEQSIPFGRMGTYRREGDKLLLQADADSLLRFTILEDRLVLLDKDGTEILSGLDYSLKQATPPANLTSIPFIARGLIKNENKSTAFTLCGQQQAWTVVQDRMLKDAERFLVKQKAKLEDGVFVQAIIELAPLADSSATGYQVKINKINELIESCR
ncbi:copper resistance protein NlpE [Flavihumibacter sp. CACIAM 22H1]|uniref:copper resistance protein NlpE n=1 Tax=Flavihumibacter sp. CACIAM 22H1 TaxID=1812911 RepID=UPI0007A87C63|nr:copper resistance protein NlpE [Flavihumibacter sp. CACIAM 22H1]KYP15811.1 MAG: hypothetical protein A1D16_10315 [Flavihumibacter sp. CACIAM 22H1]